MKRLPGGSFLKGLLAGCVGDRGDPNGDDDGVVKSLSSASSRHLSQEVVDELLFPSSPTPKRVIPREAVTDMDARISESISESVLSEKVGARAQPLRLDGDNPRNTRARANRGTTREYIPETSTAPSGFSSSSWSEPTHHGRWPQVKATATVTESMSNHVSPSFDKPESVNASAGKNSSSQRSSRDRSSTDSFSGLGSLVSSSSSSSGSSSSSRNRGLPKSDRRRSGTPTLSKSLRALSHNDFTYLGEEAPSPLREHQRSHRELLSLLSSNPLLATETVRHTVGLDAKVLQEAWEEHDVEEMAARDDIHEEYLLSLICECPGANCSVVGLLVFANPSAPALRSLRSGLTALQTALLHGGPLDIVQLLFELETDKLQFAQTPIPLESGDPSGGSGNSASLLPAELLLREIGNGKDSTHTYRLRTSLLRHSLFMSIVQAWEGSLERLGADWARYYGFWKQMHALGRAKNLHESHCSFPRALLLRAHSAGQRRQAGRRASHIPREKTSEDKVLRLLEDVARENALTEVVL